MNGFWKGVKWVLFFVLLLTGGVYAYLRWWDTSGALARIVGQVKGTAVESVEKTSGAALSNAGTSALSFAKETSANALSSLGEALGGLASSIVGESTSSALISGGGITVATSGPVSVETATSSAFLLPPPFTTVVTKVNTPLTFSVNREASYAIAWGDGDEDSGNVAPNATTLVSHAWVKEGDYTVEFTVKNSGGGHTSSFPVRVYE